MLQLVTYQIAYTESLADHSKKNVGWLIKHKVFIHVEKCHFKVGMYQVNNAFFCHKKDVK